MMETVKNTCSKYFNKRRAFFATLTVFTTMGIYSLVVGVWLYLKRTDFYELTPTSYSAFSTAGLCCSTGVAVCIICTVGWIAATAHNRRLLMTYIGFVALLAFIQSVTGILGLSYKEAAREHVRSDLFKNINRTALVTGQGRVFDLTASWDKLQKSLRCCGVNEGSDWYYSHRWPSQEFVPDSCCDPAHFSDVVSMNHCGKVANNTLLYQQGCFEVFADWLYHHVAVMNWISLTLLFVELSSLAIAVSMVNTESFFAGASGKSHDEYHRCLVMSDMEARDLRVQPNDRIGDARQDPLDNIL